MKFSRTLHSDPERMGAQDPALERALLELAAADEPSSAELRRMSQRLQVVFESPAPRRGLLLRAARGPVRFAIVGGALLMVSVGVLRVGQPGAADAPVLPRTRPAQAAPTVYETAAPAPQQLEAAPSARAPAPEKPSRSASPATKHHRSHALVPVAHPAAVSGEDTVDTTSVSNTASNANVASPAQVPSVSVPAAPAAPAPAAAPQLDEAALLQRARQLAHSEPDAALRLLAQHERRFANGMLSPEREVLAIELLGSLARTDEAAERLKAFRQRYPKSVYLKRFER